MTIAVIGASGQVADALVEAAHRRNQPLVARGRPAVDLATGTGLDAFLDDVKPLIVVNAAAYTAVDRAETEPDAAFALNAAGPARIAAICAARNVPLVQLSTDYVFDGAKRAPYTETDAIAPLGVYGASKAEGEAAIRSLWPRHIILRTQWVYGAHGANFVKTMLRLGAEREVVRVVADQHGSPTSAADIAAAILELAPRLTGSAAPAWGTYHLSGSGETTWHGFAAEIFRQAAAAGLKVPALEAIPTANYPTPARRPPYSVLDNTKFVAAFGRGLPDWRQSLAPVVARLAAAQPHDARKAIRA
jgi:dTDP-4-dehydrorhamnose reductase